MLNYQRVLEHLTFSISIMAPIYSLLRRILIHCRILPAARKQRWKRTNQPSWRLSRQPAVLRRIKLIKWFWSWDYQCIYVVDDNLDVPRMTGVKKKACLPMNSRNPVHDGGMTIPHTIWCRKMLRILPNYGQIPWEWVFPSKFQVHSGTKASFDYQRLQWFSMVRTR